MSDQEALELAEVYALDAITEQERADLLATVQKLSPEVQERFDSRVRVARETAAMLSADLQEAPPEELRLAVLSIPRQQRQQQPVRAESQPVDFTARRQAKQERSVLSRSPWLLAAVAAVLLFFGFGTGYFSGSRNTPVAQSVLEAPDMQMLTASSTEGGQLQVMLSEQRNAAVVLFSEMTALPADQAYQLWLIQDGQPVSAAVFDGGSADTSSASGTTLISDINTAQTVAMTVEPRGGVEAPTGPVVVAVTV
ncbi:anti-sigma factor [Acaricomes phytoseiuli]|uniref:anti-sigma factor n=1 Tax=Acaricomes phytoseiuli TaxID=291968 RepID=UPI00035D8001|nr:anti-sigma factor [Acaricomes phytoseiuli]MCW1249950.1 anti-sigma factor [Acaricomes phytoseiuli]